MIRWEPVLNSGQAPFGWGMIGSAAPVVGAGVSGSSEGVLGATGVIGVAPTGGDGLLMPPIGVLPSLPLCTGVLLGALGVGEPPFIAGGGALTGSMGAFGVVELPSSSSGSLAGSSPPQLARTSRQVGSQRTAERRLGGFESERRSSSI
jgi:hypothetical protein